MASGRRRQQQQQQTASSMLLLVRSLNCSDLMLGNYQQKLWKKPWFCTRSFTLSQCDWKAANLNSRNYYDILGVEKTATDKDIRKAFLKLSKEYHPDSNSTDRSLHGKFVKINEAFTILSKPSTRDDYDRILTPTTSSPVRPQPSYDRKRTSNFEQRKSPRYNDTDWRSQFDKSFFELLRRQMEQDRQRAKNSTPNPSGMLSTYLAPISIISFLIGFGVLIHALQWRVENYSTDPRSRSYHAYREWQRLSALENARSLPMRRKEEKEE